MKRKLAYLCLQATKEGQASHAHVHEIVRGLERRGWEVDVFEPSYTASAALPGAVGRLIEFLRVQARLLFRSLGNIEVVYVRSHVGALPISLISRIFGVPVVQEINGTVDDMFLAWPWTRKLSPLVNWVNRLQLKSASAVITVTPLLRDWVLQQATTQRVEVIPNGANADLFHPGAPTSYALPRQYALFFGALASWQGLNVLLEAIQLPDWPVDLPLVVVGDGAERKSVEEAASGNPRIQYLGKLPYRNLPGVIAASSMCFSPQFDDVGRCAVTGLYPLKVFETMSCGVPVVVTDYPGQADLVREHQCGMVVPANDPKSLAQAAAYLLRNPAEATAMGTRGRRAIVNEHSWDKRAADTAGLLEEVLTGP